MISPVGLKAKNFEPSEICDDDTGMFFLRFKPRFISWKINTRTVFGKMRVLTAENPSNVYADCTRISTTGKSASFVVQTFSRSQHSAKENPPTHILIHGFTEIFFKYAKSLIIYRVNKASTKNSDKVWVRKLILTCQIRFASYRLLTC